MPPERIDREIESLETAIAAVEATHPSAEAPETGFGAGLDLRSEAPNGGTTGADSGGQMPVSVPPVSPNSASAEIAPSPSVGAPEPVVAAQMPDGPVSVAKPADKPSEKQTTRQGMSTRGIITLLVLLGLGGGAYAVSQNMGGSLDQLKLYARQLNLPIFEQEGSPSDITAIQPDSQSLVPATPPADPVPADEDTKFDDRLGSNGETIAAPEPTPPEQPIETPADDEPQGNGAPNAEGTGVDGVQITVDENGVTLTVPDDQPSDDTGTGDGQAANDGGNEQVAVLDQQTDQPAADAVPRIGQRAFFYVESGAGQQTSRTSGATVWQNGERDGLPTIEAQIDLADLGLNASMVMRKNTDEALSASHVIELLFSTDESFSGGGIDLVRQVVLKETEEAQGNALIAEPAKISDGFFLIALYDLPEATSANTRILRERSWIDIPLAYTTGRRALLTIEKGANGDAVFERAFQAWGS